MTEYVRVKDPVSGHEFTTSAEWAKSADLTVVDKAAVDDIGRVLPSKPNIRPRSDKGNPSKDQSEDTTKEKS